MLNTIEGIYRDGKVELLETPPGVKEAKVVVTFLPTAGPIKLQDVGITPAEAAEMRAGLVGFIEDWDRPEMDVYNDL